MSACDTKDFAHLRVCHFTFVQMSEKAGIDEDKKVDSPLDEVAQDNKDGELKDARKSQRRLGKH